MAFNVRNTSCYPADAVRAGRGARRGREAFFRVAKDLYGLASINYVCINISVSGRAKYFTHCVYSDSCVKQFASNDAIPFEMKSDNKLGSGNIDVLAKSALKRSPHIVLALNKRRSETAFLGINSVELLQRSGQYDALLRECRILANYFHGHVLRMNGYDTDQEILISARELGLLEMDGCRQDCSGGQYHFGDQRANSKVSFECGAGKVGLRDDNPSRC